MTRTAITAIVALSLVGLAGCGGGDSDDVTPDPSASFESSAAAQSPSSELRPLSDVCEQIEEGLPRLPASFPTNASERESVVAYATELRAIAVELDTESADAVEDLAFSMDEAAELSGDPLAGVEASEEMDRGVGRIRDDCGAAGVPIFQ